MSQRVFRFRRNYILPDIFDVDFVFIILPPTVLLAATTRTLVTTPLFIEIVTFSPAFNFDKRLGTAPIMILAELGIDTVLLVPMLFINGFTVKVDAVIDKTVPLICVILPLEDDIFDEDILEDDIRVELIFEDDIFDSVFADTGNSAVPKMLNAAKPDAMLLKLFMANSPFSRSSFEWTTRF